MQVSLERLTAFATFVGTAAGIIALIQSSAWLVSLCLIFVCVSVAACLYARQKRLILTSASTVIEGHSIDSLNVANLRRRVNRTFFIQKACHTVRIEGENMEITWQYSGYCRKDNVSSMEFSIDSDEGTPFDKLECFAFDLANDPGMKHRLRPVLIGTEGISKKVSVTFLEPLRADQPFSVTLTCSLPRCVKMGFGYYTSTSSFSQRSIQRSIVQLIFEGVAPQWVRVYEGTVTTPIRLIKSLPPSRQEPGICEYVDVVNERQGRSTRIYAFWRDDP